MHEIQEKDLKRVMSYRWLVFFTVALTMFFVMFQRNSMGVMKTDLTETFGLNATTFSCLSSMYFLPYVIMQLPIGILADRVLGARKTIAFSFAVSVIGTLIFASAGSYTTACIGRMLIGVGVSDPAVCSQKLLASWFREREIATVGGVNGIFSALGTIAAQVPLAVLVSIFSWRYTFVATGAACALTAVVCFVWMKDSPESMGLPSMAQIEGRAAQVRPGSAKNESILNVLKNMFSNRGTWPVLIMMPAFMGASTLFSGTWGVPYIKEVYGYSTVEAAAFTTYYMFGSMSGNIAVNFCSDRLATRKKPIIFCAATTVILWVLMTYGSGIIIKTNSLGVVVFLSGFFGSMILLLFAAMREVNDPAYVGIIIGASNTIGMSAAAAFPVICGMIIDSSTAAGISGSALYRNAFSFMVGAFLIAFISSLFIKETSCRNIHHMQKNPEK